MQKLIAQEEAPQVHDSSKNALYLAVLLLFAGIFVEYSSIAAINSGKFVYTLDDAYIHLALAENIIDGHYGVNTNEFSAPSSSILWPFLLAPFARTNIAEYVPLWINAASAIGTLFLFFKILERVILVQTGKIPILSILLILLIGVTNLIGLIFTGMEHSLQLLFSVAVLWGLIVAMEEQTVTPWLTAGVILGPLIRYENIALSVAALLFFILDGRWKRSLLLCGVLAACVGGFSLYLIGLGLHALPTSTFAKSMILSSGGASGSILKHLRYSLTEPAGVLLLAGMFALLCFGFLSKEQSRTGRIFAWSLSLSILMHLTAGLYGWYHRYEMYIWTVTILALLYLARSRLSFALNQRRVRTLCVVGLFGVLVSFSYIIDLQTIPLASNNIYQQHFQMHRFAVDYYRGAVAVNDLGYVSFRNPYHVLDLFGLASDKALALRTERSDSDWMNTLADAHNVQLAMIYDNAFRRIPGNWYKVGELRLGKRRVTAYHNVVSFYALKRESVPPIFNLLYAFRTTLPEGVTLTLLRPRL